MREDSGQQAIGRALLAAQFSSLGGLAWPGRRMWDPPRPLQRFAWAAATGGTLLMSAAALQLGRNLRVAPRPAEDAPLQRDGVYGIVRHPIYAGLLTAATGVAVLRARRGPLVALAGLAAVLHAKAGHEEQLLRDRFGADYDAYADAVPRLIPRPRW